MRLDIASKRNIYNASSNARERGESSVSREDRSGSRFDTSNRNAIIEITGRKTFQATFVSSTLFLTITRKKMRIC